MFAFISAVAKAGFYRCGTFFPNDGILVDLKEFTEKQVERLKNEAMLRLTEPTEDQLQAGKADDAEGLSELRFDLAEVMRSLAVEDFQKDGKPKMDALKTLMPKGTKFNAALRDEVWDAMVEDGFVAPTEGEGS